MTTNLDPASEYFLAQVNRIQETMARASREVSSGKRIAAPSDAPDEIGPVLQLRAAQRHNAQVQSNLQVAKTEADAADDALAASIKAMDSALVLANQGLDTMLDAGGRQALAQQVDSLIEQIVARSRTTVQGRYIFSGNDNDAPAYEVDWTAPNGVRQLSSAPANSRVEAAAGRSFAATKTAQEIFDAQNDDGTPAAGNVFAALSALRNALGSNDPDAIAAAAGSLRAASAHLNLMEGFYGGVQNRIRDAVDGASQYDVQLQTELSRKEDADVVAAALAMTQANTHMQAAFEMRARLPHTSLFDYLG